MIILFLLTIFVLNTSIIYSTPPTLNIITPLKYENYIVSTPEIIISLFDEDGIDFSSLKMSLNYIDITKNCFVTDDKIIYKVYHKLKKGNQVVKIEVCDLLGNKVSDEWYFTVGPPTFNHYYGLLNINTYKTSNNFTFDDCYYIAKYNKNLDFMSISNINTFFDSYFTSTISNSSDSTSWNELTSSASKFNNSHEFIGMYGFKINLSNNISDLVGHINVFNTKGFIPHNSNTSSLKNFYSYLSSYDANISQFNHPNDFYGSFDNFKYTQDGDYAMRLFEVFSGNDVEFNKNIISDKNYQLALDKGWHIAPTASSTDISSENELRSVILSTNLTHDSLIDAIYKLRVYATSDKNIKIDFTINDMPMGSTIKNMTTLNFYISAIDKDYKDKIKKIQVLSKNGKIIADKDYNSNLAKLEFSIKHKTPTFYYIKVYQDLDKFSITAPIWIE